MSDRDSDGENDYKSNNIDKTIRLRSKEYESFNEIAITKINIELYFNKSCINDCINNITIKQNDIHLFLFLIKNNSEFDYLQTMFNINNDKFMKLFVELYEKNIRIGHIENYL